MLVNKKGVSLLGLKPEMVPVLINANEIYSSKGVDCVVTSGTDGNHSRNSRHYLGLALDFRIRHLSSGEDYQITEEDRVIASDIVKSLSDALGEGYFVLLESTHIHVEYRGFS